MILRYEVTVEVTNENFNKYGIGGIRNAITDAVEKHPFIKATYSANVYEESRFSKDLQEFANAKIAVHIKNREEYNQFMTALYKNGYDIRIHLIFKWMIMIQNIRIFILKPRLPDI